MKLVFKPLSCAAATAITMVSPPAFVAADHQ